jgi:hypothetical protein
VVIAALKRSSEWESPLKRGHPEEGASPTMVDARVRLRYTEGGLRAEELRGRGVQSGCSAEGRQALWRFRRKTATYPEKRKASASILRGAEKMGSWVGNTHGHAGFGWFGPQNHHRLIWAGRGLDKIETLKSRRRHVAKIAGMRRS